MLRKNQNLSEFPKSTSTNGGKGLESTEKWMKPGASGPHTNSQLVVIKEKQPWELSVIFFKDNKENKENISNMSKPHPT